MAACSATWANSAHEAGSKADIIMCGVRRWCVGNKGAGGCLLALIGRLEYVLESSHHAQKVGEGHIDRVAQGVQW